MQGRRADHGVELPALQIFDPVVPAHVQLDPTPVGIVGMENPRQRQQHGIVVEPDDLGAGQAGRQAVAQAARTAAEIEDDRSHQTGGGQRVGYNLEPAVAEADIAFLLTVPLVEPPARGLRLQVSNSGRCQSLIHPRHPACVLSRAKLQPIQYRR